MFNYKYFKMKKIIYIMVTVLMLGSISYSCTPEALTNSLEQACCGEEENIPPPPPSGGVDGD